MAAICAGRFHRLAKTQIKLLSRLDKVRGHREARYTVVEMVFDGKTVSALAKHLNAYVQVEGPDSVDQLMEALRVGHFDASMR